MVDFHSKKIEFLLKAGISFFILLLINQLFSLFYFRIDLTEDKRYTFSQASKEILKTMPHEMRIDVYLEGKMPAGFLRLRNQIEENLKEINMLSDGKASYHFIDPSAEPNRKRRNQLYLELARKGIQPTNTFDTKGDEKKEKLLFPGAVLHYQGHELAVEFLKGNKSLSPQQQLNQSVENIEYTLISAIRQISQVRKKRIGYMSDNPKNPKAQAFRSAIRQQYVLTDLNAKKLLKSNPDAVVVTELRRPLSEAAIFQLDQYVMKGGKVLFLIDKINVAFDSIFQSQALAFPKETGLESLLFKYGLRINADLVQDLNSGAIPVVVGQMGGQPNIQLVKWPYLVIANRFGGHSITKNMDAVFLRFASSLDTVKSSGITKTPLLMSSRHSKRLQAPVDISMNALKKDFKPESFNQGNKVFAYLAEGQFPSVFRNRFLPEGYEGTKVIPQSKKTSIIVVGDSDIMLAEKNPKSGEYEKLGKDPYTKLTFANEDFLMNALAYLTEGKKLMQARAKTIRIRQLDALRIKEERTFWQAFNLLLPLAFLLLFGSAKYFLRKRKYTRFK